MVFKMDEMRRLLRPDSKVATKIRSWFDRKSFRPAVLRELQLGLNVTVISAEVVAYKMIKENMQSGELPYYMTDVLIIMIAMLEGILCPLISWWGYQRRRKIFIAYSIIALVFSFSWLFLPHARKVSVSVLCDAANQNNPVYEGVTGAAIARLLILVTTCFLFKITCIACWSHGFAYSDEHAPEITSEHYGITMVARLITLVLGDRVLTGSASDIFIQAWPLVLGFIINVILAMFVLPIEEAEEHIVENSELSKEDRGFLVSAGRVLYNSSAISQIFAMGLMAASLWGYLYNEIDIISVKFSLNYEKDSSALFSELFLYYLLIIIVLYVATNFATSSTLEFCRIGAIKQIIVFSILSFVTYVVLTTVPRCDRGLISGLSRDKYDPPGCSLSCDCKPDWREFHPVCAVEDMVTYLSPCQAGCQNSETVNGVIKYTNCTCTTYAIALRGACSDSICSSPYKLHRTLIFILVSLAALVFHTQGVLLLRVVNKEDKSVVMGIAWAVVVIFTYTCGHLIFLGLRVSTCSWFEAKRCHMYSQLYPTLVGIICCVLSLLSVLVSFGSWMTMRESSKIMPLQETHDTINKYL